jgi:integrase
VLARVLSVAKDRGRITVNPCEGGGRLYQSDRTDRVWGEAEIAKLLSVAPSHMETMILLVLWTGQRQGDLLRLPWSAYDGRYIRLRQSKRKKEVVIPVGEILRASLDATPKRSTVILTNSRGGAWTSDGFRTSWADLVVAAGLSAADLHFHDFRGTAVTRLAIAGATEAEIATITGLSLDTVRQILDRHYLNRDVLLAESAISKLEKRFGKRS